jgi:hypothetical protein
MIFSRSTAHARACVRAARFHLAPSVRRPLAEIDEFVSADMRCQRASDSDLQLHPAVNHLVREAYAAVPELVENPASEKVGRTLADVRERFDGAAAIFGHPMFELQSPAVALSDQLHAAQGGILARPRRSVKGACGREERMSASRGHSEPELGGVQKTSSPILFAGTSRVAAARREGGFATICGFAQKRRRN